MLIRTSNVPVPDVNIQPPVSMQVTTHPPTSLCVGTMLRCYARLETVTGPHEPASLKFQVTDPRGQMAEYTNVECDAPGSYFVRVSLRLAGPYELRVSTSGDDAQVATKSFVVSD